MQSFLNLLLFAGVCITVSADPTPESYDPCNLEHLNVYYPVDTVADAVKPCGIERDFEDVSGQEAPEVSMKIKALPDLLEFGDNPFEVPDQDEDAFFFTLVMVDPDAPTSKPDDTNYFLHWLIVDIQGADFTEGHGLEIKTYLPPSPPAGKGLHRYQFFAFKQPMGHFTDTVYGIPDNRNNFNLKNFQTNNGFSAPVAGYQFQTKRN